MLAACVALWVTRATSEQARGATLACATLLATPFLLDYDLTLLAVPLAFLFRSAARDGFLPWEKITLAVGFVLPLIARGLVLIPVGIVAM